MQILGSAEYLGWRNFRLGRKFHVRVKILQLAFSICILLLLVSWTTIWTLTLAGFSDGGNLIFNLLPLDS